MSSGEINERKPDEVLISISGHIDAIFCFMPT